FWLITLLASNGIPNPLAQNAQNCSRCLRTPVRDVPGPNKGEKGEAPIGNDVTLEYPLFGGDR
ncbi:hypothetical protein, partial [Mesorhizobium sp. M1E.F.Ca.ET.041.01.1.1]|uniref:hypothetical protein n=1 Tax=Mesorhizobium sp. M1E.F.Ca.ET.041.01.1.1 TaxID=2496759 RepID=UPI001AECEEBB